MKKELKEIEKNLKATLSGFKDAKEMYGYDLANETYYVKEALKQVKLLDLHSVRKLLIAFEQYYSEEYGEKIVSGSIDSYIKHISN